MEGQFSGNISTADNEDPVKLTHHIIVDNSIDPRISVIKEYLLKVPDASLKDLKKALTGFSKASENELKTIIKSANEKKFNELYPKSQQTKQKFMRGDNKGRGESFTTKEIIFFEKYRNSQLKRGKIFELYQREFPISKRKIQSVSDYYYYHPNPPKNTSHISTGIPVLQISAIKNPHSNEHILAKTIRSLYKAGFTPETLPKAKPINNELLSQNCDYGEIELAIEYLKS